MDHAIRTARPEDLDALLRLEATFPGDRLSRRALRHHLRNPRACLRVALDGGSVVGDALLLRRAGSREARLYSLVVDPAWRGRGWARRLLDDAETCARRTGCRALRLEVRCDNAAAIALYRAAGYREAGRIEGFYDDGSAALRMRKALDAPGAEG